MKKTGIILLLVLSFTMVKAQQVPIYTQYIFNNFLFNPAIAGTHNYYQIRSNTRVQWVGMTDHPLTNTLSAYGPHKSQDMGFGGYVYSDATGPTTRTGFSGAYAYNMSMTEDIRVSFGAALGLLQFKQDMSQVELWNNDDPLADNVYSNFVPTASIGAYMYSYNFHVGLSTKQLLNNKLKREELNLDNGEEAGISRLKTHLYLTAGYKYFFSRDHAIEPTIIFKKGFVPAPFQMDLTPKYIYKNMVWGALSFRTSFSAVQSLSILAGYIHEKQFYFGYSYDIGVAKDIRYFNSGSHELTIGYRFNEIK